MRDRLFSQHHDFAPGDLVTWKPGMKHQRYPRYGQPAWCWRSWPPQGEAGNTYFRDPLDLVLGLIWEKG